MPDDFHLLRGDILARMDRLPEAEVEMREEIRLHPRAGASAHLPRARSRLRAAWPKRGAWSSRRRTAIPRLDAFVKGVATLNYFGDRAGAEALKRRGHALYPDDPRLKSGS